MVYVAKHVYWGAVCIPVVQRDLLPSSAPLPLERAEGSAIAFRVVMIGRII